MRYLLLFLILTPGALALEWSEILFDPVGSDNGLEFVELIGGENLSGCTIRDTKSSDTLELLQKGTDVILIVEIDGTYQNNTNATVYSAGKAIGNGLGNSYEELTITCDDILLETSYNTSELDFRTGMSIFYDDGWILGVQEGSPGYVETPEQEAEIIPVELPVHESSGSTYCNTTLALSVGAYSGKPGDVILFSIISSGLSSFDVMADEELILEGDTLTRRDYSLVLPEVEEVVLTAYASQCDAKQRAKRIILVEQPMPVVVIEEIVENETVEILAEPEEEILPVNTPENTTLITGNVVYDQNKNVVPWVSGFGMITLLVSTGLFLHLRKEEARD